MTWSSVAPDGTKSVKANRAILGNNTSYIETTMGNSAIGTNNAGTRDHFWNVGSDEDGHHRFVKSPAFTVGGNPTDPVVGTGMDGVIYLKSDGLTPSRVQGFYRNASNVYQYIPAFLTGTVVVGGSFVSVTTVPPLCYGDIFMYRAGVDGGNTACRGFFKSTATIVDSWSLLDIQDNLGQEQGRCALRFGNATNNNLLNIMATTANASAPAGNTWTYIITYRSL